MQGVRMNRKLKKCPFCGEDILAVAIKCKYCESMPGSSGGASQCEEICADIPANLFRGFEAVGGKLKITSSRVLFDPHDINLQKMPAEIPLSDIAEVRKRNTWGIIPNGLLIRTKTGVEYKFVAWGRDRLISVIEELTSAN